MMNIQQAKEKIQFLIKKYELEKSSNKISQYTEAETKTGFIEPFFQALGWDTQNRDEVSLETTLSKGRVDYSFKLNGIIKFFVEAKPFRADLDNIEYAKQAINYAWHKGVSWAVLTDFEGIKVFNAEWKEDIQKAKVLDLKYTDYITDFDLVYLLSKEKFVSGELDKWSEKFGKKIKKLPVSKQILDDLLKSREKLTKSILKHPKKNKVSDLELDECVQRILDRLIFIRTCEDRNIEQNQLLTLIRTKDKNDSLNYELQKIFRRFDDLYNSKLFAKHLCDDLTIDDEVLEEIIESLYQTKDGSIYYDFSVIEADVLGNIYEQYLGHILKKTSSSAVLKEKHQHRKEQGIYYTPTYIVDYIVKNTLGEILKTAKPDQVRKLRILDPACGSGSFLIRAFDELVNYWRKKQPNEFEYLQKIEILKNNIYGVDLDKQAVEITQMNLLLKTIYREQKLPLLENIKCGNSLIDDLQVAGEKAFKWEEEFKEVISEGGFDVIIGNPPYVLQDKNKNTNYKWNTDLYLMFFEKMLKGNLLKKDGYLGFITPRFFLVNKNCVEFRKFLIKELNVIKIVETSPFEEANTECVISIIKNSKKQKDTIEILKDYDGIINNYNFIKKENIVEENDYLILTDIKEEIINLLKKIENSAIVLKSISQSKRGMEIGKNDLKSNSNIKVLVGEDVNRYSIQHCNTYVSSNNPEYLRLKEFFEKENKIYLRRVAKSLIATVSEKEYSYNKNIYGIKIIDSQYNHKYVLGLLNSKLLTFYYLKKFSTKKSNLFPEIQTYLYEKLPIYRATQNQQLQIIEKVDKMLELNKKLQSFGDKITDERKKVELEIQKTDNEIDQLVYKLYGLTEEEIKIIEESFIK